MVLVFELSVNDKIITTSKQIRTTTVAMYKIYLICLETKRKKKQFKVFNLPIRTDANIHI